MRNLDVVWRCLETRHRFWILGAVAAVGTALRLWGNSFGLPYLYHPDEGAVVMPALKILHTGSFNPDNFYYGSVHIYALFIVYVFYFLVGARQGVFRVVQDIPFYDNLTDLTIYEFPTAYIVARSVSALFGLGMILVAYLLGKRMWGTRAGLVASVLLALLPPLVLDAHYATTDTAVAFFVLVVTYFSFRLYESGTIKYYLLAGFTSGIAISTKYSFASAIIPATAHVLRNWRTRRQWDLKLIALTSLSLMLGFLLGTPFAVFDFTRFLNDVALVLRIYASSGGSPPLEPSYLWWLKHMLRVEILPLTGLSLLGLVLLLKRRPREALMLAAFPALHFLLMVTQKTHYPRLWLPAAAIMILFATYALLALGERLSRVIQPVRFESGWMILLLPLITFWCFIAVQYDWRMTQTDIRTETLDWAQESLPVHSRVAVDLGGPPLSASEWDVTRVVKAGYHSLSWYQEQGYSYLIVSQPVREEPNLTQQTEKNYNSIEAEATLVKVIQGYWLHLADQRIWVYHVPDPD